MRTNEERVSKETMAVYGTGNAARVPTGIAWLDEATGGWPKRMTTLLLRPHGFGQYLPIDMSAAFVAAGGYVHYVRIGHTLQPGLKMTVLRNVSELISERERPARLVEAKPVLKRIEFTTISPQFGRAPFKALQAIGNDRPTLVVIERLRGVFPESHKNDGRWTCDKGAPMALLATEVKQAIKLQKHCLALAKRLDAPVVITDSHCCEKQFPKSFDVMAMQAFGTHSHALPPFGEVVAFHKGPSKKEKASARSKSTGLAKAACGNE